MGTLPWYKEYKILGIPKTFKPYPDKPVYDILEIAAKKYKKNGLIQENFFLSYPELLEYVNKLASAFQGFGLKKNDIIATILPTSTEFVICDYAIAKVGLIHLPCSALEPAEALEHKFKEAKPYLEKAWELNPKDQSTMVSLKQLYATLNDTVNYAKVKAALDAETK